MAARGDPNELKFPVPMFDPNQFHMWEAKIRLFLTTKGLWPAIVHDQTWNAWNQTNHMEKA